MKPTRIRHYLVTAMGVSHCHVGVRIQHRPLASTASSRRTSSYQIGSTKRLWNTESSSNSFCMVAFFNLSSCFIMFHPFSWRQQPSLEDVDTPIADGSCIIFPLRTKQKTETAAASQVLVVVVWRQYGCFQLAAKLVRGHRSYIYIYI